MENWIEIMSLLKGRIRDLAVRVSRKQVKKETKTGLVHRSIFPNVMEYLTADWVDSYLLS